MTAAPPIRVDATASGLALDQRALAAGLATLPRGMPVVVMIHGYRFAPAAAGDNCPHGHIFSLEPPAHDRKAISWPRHLGLDGLRGLAIGFGWQARGSLRQALGLARALGSRLADLARMVAAIDPGRQVDVVGHSLGARVALSALPHAEPGQFRRLILLAGAERRRPALAAMASPAGQAVEVFNISSRENDVFDFLFELITSCGFDSAIGLGPGRPLANWLDLQIDQPATLRALAGLGHDLPQAARRICHWSPYLRPGTFPLYRAMLDGALPMEMLRQHLPAATDRRWTRLFNLSERAGPGALPA